MTFYTYILKSLVADRIYIGHTGNLENDCVNIIPERADPQKHLPLGK